MLLSNKPDIKETIISILSKSSVDSTELQKEVVEQKKVTKQGFYKALRELVAEEIVVKNKQLLLLNNFWINRLHEFIGNVDKTYQLQDSFLNLQEGESLVYHFKTIASLDALWMHYFFIIAKKKPTEPIIFYNAHEFWSLFRYEVESFMYKWIADNNRKTYLVVGGNTALDRTTTAYIKEFGLDITYEIKPSFKKNYFTTVIGDYILDTILDMNTANTIDRLYQKHTIWNEEVAKELGEILSRLKRSKVVIYRNKKKAEQLRKKLMKYFVFYK